MDAERSSLIGQTLAEYHYSPCSRGPLELQQRAQTMEYSWELNQDLGNIYLSQLPSLIHRLHPPTTIKGKNKVNLCSEVNPQCGMTVKGLVSRF